MLHFAYPNVKATRNEFIGCGRYVALFSGHAPEERYELAEPKITKISEVQTAASILAKESFDTGKGIYEIKDRTDEVYRGDSQDLAYLLVLISRSRQIGAELKNDIWCTGSIDISDGKKPFLNAVKPVEFEIKLKAFLSENNTDKLFIVPAPNIQPAHEEQIRKENVSLLSLNQFRNLKNVSEKKNILKVHGNELGLLVSVLFQKPLTGRLKQISFIFIAALILAILFRFAPLFMTAWDKGIGQLSDSFHNQPEEQTEPVTGMEFIKMPGGCYEMGCDGQDCISAEKPLHEVCVDDFWIGKYRLTQGQRKKIMIQESESDSLEKGDDDAPADISWDEAQEFIRKLKEKTGENYRLPTEAEWEYACRKALSENMLGNMWEWCEDEYIDDAYQRHPRKNPVMKNISGEDKVIRGGGLPGTACSSRFGRASEKGTGVGLRLVKIP
jgi:formylglycine-generating enzyme required for sulfatase activity